MKKSTALFTLGVLFGGYLLKDSILPLCESLSNLAQTQIAHIAQTIQRLDEQDQVDHEITAQKKAQDAGCDGECMPAIGFTAGEDYGGEEEEEDD